MRERGFALLSVLWTLVILALMAAQFTANGRGAARTAGFLHAAAIAELAAGGAVHHAVSRLIRGDWRPDGPTYQVQIGEATSAVRITSERGKLNPNAATAAAVQDLLRRIGVGEAQAAQLAQAIVDWRSRGPRSASGESKAAQYRRAGLSYAPTNHGFDSVSELDLVVGMTPAILLRLRPLISVFQEGDGTGLEDAATTSDPWSMGQDGRVMTVVIEAVTTSRAGGRFTRRAIIRLRADPGAGQTPFEVLTWEAPD